MKEDERLVMKILELFRCKYVLISELYLAIEVVAAALGIEMRRRGMVLVAFLAALGVTEALCVHWQTHSDVACHRVARRAVMEAHIPTDRDEQHHKGQQKTTDLQQTFFHGRKNTKSNHIIFHRTCISKSFCIFATEYIIIYRCINILHFLWLINITFLIVKP